MNHIIEILRNLRNWLLSILRWLFVEPWKFWFTLLPFFIGGIFCWLIPAGIFCGSNFNDTLETRLRLTGLFLELLGIVSVVYGLNETLKLFEDVNLPHIFSKWIKRFPKFEDNNISITGGSFDSTLSALINISPPSPDTPLPDRVALLEKNLSQTNEWIFKIQKHLTENLTNESFKREVGDKQAQQALQKFAIGDVYMELIGIIWLIPGAILATASTELAQLIG